MDRKKFLKSISITCLCASPVASLLNGCAATGIISGKIYGDELLVAKSSFDPAPANDNSFRNYIIVQNDILLFPICIYRLSENEYTALWMRCTHQGSELQVFGDRLACPAHGSEFDNKGSVKNGPAEEKLRTFPVVVEEDRIRISLKAR
jgi:nitrite reductase/ring-hydroxylating ferredoxin subunit